MFSGRESEKALSKDPQEKFLKKNVENNKFGDSLGVWKCPSLGGAM
jgi:hypothetical protein